MPRWRPPANSLPRRWRLSLNRRSRILMVRIILFLVLIALAAAGAAWIAEQSGDVALTWSGGRIQTPRPVFALAIGIAIVAAIMLWSLVRGLWRAPAKLRRRRH